MASITIGSNIPMISHRVYNNGINEDIIADKSGKALVLALLDQDGNIIAFSAAIKNSTNNTTGAAGKKSDNNWVPSNAESVSFYGVNGGFKFDNKVLTIPEISYVATKNTKVVKTEQKQAKYFALFYIDDSKTGNDYAFDGANFFKFPLDNDSLQVFTDSNVLLIGEINGSPYISDNSNFRLTQTTISFSEQNNA